MTIGNFIFDRLPGYFKQNDTYKDSQDMGILERFLSVIGLYLDEETIPAIEHIIDQRDPYTAADEMLSYLGYELGSPEDILGDEAYFRNALTQFITVYKIKGTLQSYELMFALFGLSVTIEEFFPGPRKYDSGLKYDTPAPNTVTYDTDICSVGCTDYSLHYSNLPGHNAAPLNAEQLNKLQLAIESIQPINARLRELQYIG